MKKTIQSAQYLRGAIDMCIANYEEHCNSIAPEIGLDYDIISINPGEFKVIFSYTIELKEIGNSETGPQTESINAEDWFIIGIKESLLKLNSYVEDVLEKVYTVELHP